MKKLLSFILVVVFLMFTVVIAPVPVSAADRQNFSVGELTILKDIVGAAFKIATKAMANSTNWTLSKAESLCNFLKLTGSGSSDSVIVPLAFLKTGDVKVIRNGTDHAIIFKKYGGTSYVSIPTGNTAIVVYDGSNYVRVTENVAH